MGSANTSCRVEGGDPAPAQGAQTRVDDHMTRARRLVENHISSYGRVPYPDRIKEAIAAQSQDSFDLGYRAAGGIGPTPPSSEPVAERLEKLEDQANELRNSFGRGSYADGLVRDRLASVEAEISELNGAHPQPAAGAEREALGWPSREVIAREIRLAMLDNPTDESFNKRAEKREAIANDAADVIIARFNATSLSPVRSGREETCRAALQKLDNLLDFSDEDLEPVWTFEDLASIKEAFAQARAALKGGDHE